MPVSTRSPPIAISTLCEVRAKAREERRERLDREAPRARTECRARANRPPAAPRPFVTVASEAATARIAARIGPMQGVQPNAKASPIT